jgi:demethylmenaquinone methyltransferase/2-methoxy-6-polyprenyl-1,4-benzoquinol methylase
MSSPGTRGADPEKDPARIREMFDAVAPRYDFLNHLLSGGVDGWWRRRTIAALELSPGDRLLDLCAGTGDLGFEALRRVADIEVVGVDLAHNMLTRGEAKRNGTRYRFVQGDIERVPLPDASVDHACVGFGIRNVASLETALAETVRVLRPGGRFAVLEFTLPPNPVWGKIYRTYFHHVLPRLGGWISGRRDAYAYLPESVSRFPRPPDLARGLVSAGFREVSWTLLSGGIAALHLAHR